MNTTVTNTEIQKAKRRCDWNILMSENCDNSIRVFSKTALENNKLTKKRVQIENIQAEGREKTYTTLPK